MTLAVEVDKPRTYRTRRFSGARLCWGRIRQLRSFTMRDLVTPGLTMRVAQSFVEKAVTAGLVQMTSQPDKSAGAHKAQWAVYTLVRDIGRRCPRFDKSGAVDPSPQPHERMWAAIKPLRSGFTIRELAALTRTHQTNTWKYIGALRRHGYVEALVEPIGGVEGRYRLKPSMNTGPDAPQLLRGGSLWDPNRDILITGGAS